MSSATKRFLQHLEDQRRTLKEEVEQDVAPLRALSLEERGRVLASVCRDAMAIVRARPDAEVALMSTEPRSPESLALWQRLVDRYRDGRH